MQHFLEHTVEYLLQKYGDKLADMYVVFPNRRARLYFNRYLSQKITKPVMAPRFFTSNEFMQKLSGLTIADNLYLLLELFGIYKDVTKSNQTFDTFYFYTETILADFDDIDKYLVDAGDLYQNLSALKSIDAYFEFLTREQINYIKSFWDTINLEKTTEEQKDFISFWESLSVIYSRFNALLDEQKLAYEGKIYRDVITRFDEIKHKIASAGKVIFIGFNALNRCEEKLFGMLQATDKAEFYWDFHPYYIENAYHDAGYFLREYLRKFPMPADFKVRHKDDFFSANIRAVSVPSNIGQGKIIPEILKSLSDGSHLLDDQTAIILTDESLLLPVLHSIPDEQKSLNVSMGYPVKYSSAMAFIKIYLELHAHSKSKGGKELYYHHRDVTALLSTPFLSVHNEVVINAFAQRIKENNLVYIHGDELTKLSDVCSLLFKKVNDSKTLLDNLIAVLRYFWDNESKPDERNTFFNAIEHEILIKIYTRIIRIRDLVIHAATDISIQLISQIIQKVLSALTVPFTGEPLEGLQILGILETRVIDFKNIIILSMNEGTFPKAGNAPSFIPYNLRKGFMLPAIEHQDSIFSYYFYRLLHCAENCYLVYNSSKAGIFANEKSRFITQLDLDPLFQVRKTDYSYSLSATPSKDIVIPGEEKAGWIERYSLPENEMFFSPSAVHSYIGCSLKFYFRYIKQLKPIREVDDEIANNTFGSILHKTMYLLYNELQNREVNKNDLQKLIASDDIKNMAIEKAVLEEYYKSESKNVYNNDGRILLLKEVIKKYVDGILLHDLHNTPFTITGLEKKYFINFKINDNGTHRNIKLGGIVDRIDRTDKLVRVIDYKTGITKSTAINIGSLFEEQYAHMSAPVFQILVYCKILSEEFPTRYMQPALYFIRDIYNVKFNSHITVEKKNITGYEDISSVFEERLLKIIQEISDKKVPFRQTKNMELCKYCDFNLICHR